MLRFKVVANVPQGKSTLWYGYEEAVWSQGKHAKATYTTPEMTKRYTYQQVVNHVWPAPRLLQSHPVFPPLSFRCTPNKPASDSAPGTYVLILQSSWRKILCVTFCHYCLWNLVASRRSLMHFGSSWIKPSARISSPILWNIPIDIVSLFRIFPVLAAKAHHHKVSPLMDRMLPCRKRWSQGSAHWCPRTSIPRSWTCATYPVSLAEVHCNQWLTSEAG